MTSIKKILSLLIFISIFFSCTEKSPKEIVTLTGKTMGTTYSIKFVGDPNSDIPKIKNDIDSTLREVNQQMSTYITTSEISMFNSHIDTSWFEISDDLAFVISTSLEICKASNGALDITVGPLVNLWGFGPDNKVEDIPSDSVIQSALQSVGWENVKVRMHPPAIKKLLPDIYCDLSSTAKGFGVDKVAAYFEKIKMNNYLIEIGGELKSKGKKDNENPWKVGISKPDHLGGIHEIIYLNNEAMATSGDYLNYFEEDGVRFSHTINPLTGRPITHKLASVTVIAETCLLADGYATALDVMGEDLGFKFAQDNGIGAYFIHRQNDKFIVNFTEKFEKLIIRN